MIPGTVTRTSEDVMASAATIHPKSDVVRLTGTTSIANISPTFSGFGGILFLIPTGGNVGLLATGNIATAATMLNNRITTLIYSKSAGKWFVSAVAV